MQTLHAQGGPLVYHRRRAAYLRALAASTTTVRLKELLLMEAQQHEMLVEDAVEESADGPSRSPAP
jgi:hypothetical protein